MCKKIRNKKFLLDAEKKNDFFKLEFYTNAATSRLKEQSPTWNCKKNENKANTHYETYCSKH